MFNNEAIRKLQQDVVALNIDHKSLAQENYDLRDRLFKLETFLGVERRDVLVPATKGPYPPWDVPATVGWEYVKKEKKRG